MAVSPGYQAFVLDQLRRVVPSVRERRMFGAVGLYSGELFFALIDDDILYLKVDDETRPEFEARGMKPFQPYGDGTTSMNYQQLPEDVLEDPDALRQWSQRALDVARRSKAKPKRKTKSTVTKRATAKRTARSKAKAKPATHAKQKPKSKQTARAKTPVKKRRA